MKENMRLLLFFFGLGVEQARCKNVGYFVLEALGYQMKADILT